MHKNVLFPILLSLFICSSGVFSQGVEYEILSHRIILKQFATEIDPNSISFNDLGHTVGGRFRRVQRYVAWPGITQAKNGDIIVVFSGDRDFHVCPWGKVQMIRSTDLGKTWSEPVTIANTPLDDRDAGIMTTSNGTVIVNWFNSMHFSENKYYSKYYKRHAEKITVDVREKWLGYWIIRSEDHGSTWGDPIRISCSSPSNACQLSNGNLFFVGLEYRKDPFEVIMIKSADEGRSWNIVTDAPFAQSFAAIFREPHAVEVRAGGILAVFRQHGKPGDRSDDFIFQSFSEDYGKTWSRPKATPMLGYPPHLQKLENGWILCSYGRRIEPCGQRACLSMDGGKTWKIDDEIILRDDAPNEDLGYPASIQLNDGSLLTVYYQVDKEGEKPSLMTTHWRLK